MPITYTDAYLKNLVSAPHETRAITEVDAIATFTTYWRDRLIEIRAYMLVCLDSMKAPEDLFTAKLTHYRKEWNDTLVAAKIALAESGSTATPPGFFSIPLERG